MLTNYTHIHHITHHTTLHYTTPHHHIHHARHARTHAYSLCSPSLSKEPQGLSLRLALSSSFSFCLLLSFLFSRFRSLSFSLLSPGFLLDVSFMSPFFLSRSPRHIAHMHAPAPAHLHMHANRRCTSACPYSVQALDSSNSWTGAGFTSAQLRAECKNHGLDVVFSSQLSYMVQALRIHMDQAIHRQPSACEEKKEKKEKEVSACVSVTR